MTIGLYDTFVNPLECHIIRGTLSSWYLYYEVRISFQGVSQLVISSECITYALSTRHC